MPYFPQPHFTAAKTTFHRIISTYILISFTIFLFRYNLISTLNYPAEFFIPCVITSAHFLKDFVLSKP